MRRGWQPDIYGIHEYRFYSDDGKPTLLVSDRGAKSHDPPPPPGTWRAEASLPNEERVIPPGATSLLQPERLVAPTSNQGQPAESQEPAQIAAVVGTYQGPAQSMGIPTKIAYGLIIAVMCASGVAILVDHFNTKKPSIPSQTASSTTASSTLPTTSSDVQVIPVQLSPSAASSAATLVSSWADGNRTAALAVATPTAVATIFAVPYPRGLAIARGCSVAFSPIVCTYGPPGGASPNDAIFEIDVSQASGGWYVSAVKIDN